MRKIILLILILGMQYDVSFFPKSVDMPAVDLNRAELLDSSKNNIVLKCGKDVYKWENRKNLFKNDSLVGNYILMQYGRSVTPIFPGDSF